MKSSSAVEIGVDFHQLNRKIEGLQSNITSLKSRINSEKIIHKKIVKDLPECQDSTTRHILKVKKRQCLNNIRKMKNKVKWLSRNLSELLRKRKYFLEIKGSMIRIEKSQSFKKEIDQQRIREKEFVKKEAKSKARFEQYILKKLEQRKQPTVDQRVKELINESYQSSNWD